MSNVALKYALSATVEIPLRVLNIRRSKLGKMEAQIEAPNGQRNWVQAGDTVLFNTNVKFDNR